MDLYSCAGLLQAQYNTPVAVDILAAEGIPVAVDILEEDSLVEGENFAVEGIPAEAENLAVEGIPVEAEILVVEGIPAVDILVAAFADQLCRNVAALLDQGLSHSFLLDFVYLMAFLLEAVQMVVPGCPYASPS